MTFHLPSKVEKRKVDEMYRQNGFNALTSDYIALNRSVKDIRHPGCKKRLYLEDLLTVAVILPFVHAFPLIASILKALVLSTTSISRP